MKKIILLCCTLVTIQAATSQINISLSMNPRPIATINDWSGRRDVLTLIATPPPQGGARNIKINTTIKTVDGTVVATTDMQRTQVKSLLQGTNTIFYAADVVDMQAMIFAGSYQNKINSTGKLPAGNYQVIVKLDSTTLPVTLSTTQTKIFFLAATQLPILVAPANDAVLPAAAAQTAITFRWTPLVPKPAETVRYRVQVFEVLENQTFMQAMRSNQPLLDKEVLGVTQFIWQPQLSFADGASKKFVWTIQSFSFNQQLITGEVPGGEGRSEPKIFTVSSTPTGRLAKRITGL